MEEDRKLTLQEAVNMASRTHNTNVNVLGFSPKEKTDGQKQNCKGRLVAKGFQEKEAPNYSFQWWLMKILN